MRTIILDWSLHSISGQKRPVSRSPSLDQPISSGFHNGRPGNGSNNMSNSGRGYGPRFRNAFKISYAALFFQGRLGFQAPHLERQPSSAYKSASTTPSLTSVKNLVENEYPVIDTLQQSRGGNAEYYQALFPDRCRPQEPKPYSSRDQFINLRTFS